MADNNEGQDPQEQAGSGGNPSAVLGGAGSPQGDMPWNSVLDESFRNDPTISSIKANNTAEALNAMAKMTINSQKLIGADKIPALKQGATPEEKRAWLSQHLGVPESRDKYESFKEVEIGVNDKGEPQVVEVDENVANRILDLASELGLDQGSAKKLAAEYIKDQQASKQAAEAQTNEVIANNLNALRQELGNDFQITIDTANVALNRLASPELINKIAENKLIANDPDFIKLFAGLGQQLMDDSSRNGGRPNLGSLDPATAKAEIQKIRGSEEYQKVLNGTANAAYKSQVEAQLDVLYKAAYPN